MTREEAREAIKEAYGNSEYTDEIIKALEQEPVIDKIRAEIIEKFGESECAEECGCLYELLEVIDKYKAESGK